MFDHTDYYKKEKKKEKKKKKKKYKVFPENLSVSTSLFKCKVRL